jgi:hypothetical protein
VIGCLRRSERLNPDFKGLSSRGPTNLLVTKNGCPPVIDLVSESRFRRFFVVLTM